MEIYRKLAGKGCFTYNDMVEITGSDDAAQWHIKKYLSYGYIERVRRNLYVAISMETSQPIANRYQIASCIEDDSAVSHHSAFEFFGYANQVFYEVYFSTSRRARAFSYDGISYQPVLWRGSEGIIETNNGVRVTSLERTVIDSIADLDKIGGLEEVLRCIALIPSLDESKLLATLEAYGRKQLYQKVGYILEANKDALLLSDNFFDECRRHSSKSKTYLLDDLKGASELHEKWKLYAPGDLSQLTDKGVSDYDAI